MKTENTSNKKKEALLIIQIQFIFRQIPSYHGLWYHEAKHKQGSNYASQSQ